MKKDTPGRAAALKSDNSLPDATRQSGVGSDAAARNSGPLAASLLVTDTPLSFWGGVDPLSGQVIDHHHPLYGETLSGRILVMPGSRGSCSGSGVLLELLMNGQAPAGFVFREREEILSLGAVVAEELFGLSCPICFARPELFDSLETDAQAVLLDGRLELNGCQRNTRGVCGSSVSDQQVDDAFNPAELTMSDEDRAMLDGAHGQAARLPCAF